MLSKQIEVLEKHVSKIDQMLKLIEYDCKQLKSSFNTISGLSEFLLVQPESIKFLNDYVSEIEVGVPEQIPMVPVQIPMVPE